MSAYEDEVNDNARKIEQLENKRREMLTSLQFKQNARNVISKEIGSAGIEINDQRKALKALSLDIKRREAEVRELEMTLKELRLTIPNDPAADVPEGLSEADNVEINKVGTPREFDFKIKDHVDLGADLDIIDFDRAAKVSGSRFAFLKGKGSKLNRALINFMLSFHEDHGDTELTPPLLVNPESMIGTGQLPKFKDDAFNIKHSDGKIKYLIPTAEVPVTNYHANEIIEEEELPKRYFAFSPCFRAEAGSAGKDTRGLIRQDQFDKVEMVRFATREQADQEFNEMVGRVSAILTMLELPHRIVSLCKGDLGFSAEKTYDIEVWIPSQNTYREISSVSSFGEFQAKRAGIRFRPKQQSGKKQEPRALVTLNGSGIAIGRAIAAIIENHQQADGSIHIPDALVAFMGCNKIN